MPSALDRLKRVAREHPDRPALVHPTATSPLRFSVLSYAELDARTDALAHGLVKAGITVGTRVILMIKVTDELFVVLVALLKVGAVPVLVDPGMGLDRMLHCFASVGTEAMIGLPVAHLVRRLRPAFFRDIRVAITDGAFGGTPLSTLYLDDQGPFPETDHTLDDLVMITFTTGSTGPAKGVEYTHGMLDALVTEMTEVFPTEDGEVGLVTLPLFAMVDLFTGCTAVLAPMDPTKPAEVDPELIFAAIEEQSVAHFFASPALLRRIAPHVRPGHLETVTTVVCGGAAAPPGVLEAIDAALPDNASVHTTYGATEALPMATIDLETGAACRARTAAGEGVCVGQPLPHTAVRILAIEAGPVSDPTWLPAGEIGEITVSGPHVSTRYAGDNDYTAQHKLLSDDRAWHRTGDVGWLDDQGRAWLCGRKQQIVHAENGPLFPLQVEGVVNVMEGVEKSALVGVGAPGAAHPILVVEGDEGAVATVRARLGDHPLTAGVHHVIGHPRLPVDIRHNAKIRREVLAVWAGARLGLIQVPGPSPWAVLFLAAWILLAVLPWISGPLATATWWAILALHLPRPVQLIQAWPAGRRVGHSPIRIIVMTLLLGGSYWRPLLDTSADLQLDMVRPR